MSAYIDLNCLYVRWNSIRVRQIVQIYKFIDTHSQISNALNRRSKYGFGNYTRHNFFLYFPIPFIWIY